MSPITFHLLSLSNPKTFLSSLRSLPTASRPLYFGQTHHWIHEPTLGTTALLGDGPSPKKWSHLLVCHSTGSSGLDLPAGVDQSAISERWAISAPVDDEQWLANYTESHARRLSSTTGPSLPPGWSADDHSGLDAAEAPTDLAASLALHARPLGQPDPVSLKTWIADFGTTHTGPIAMFNLLSYFPPKGREQYYGYIAAFSASTGVKYGGEALFLGADITACTSADTASEKGEGEGWRDCALVWYPSLWHFGKMLDDPGYAQADREFKQGALRDNPLICCTEERVDYEG